MVTNIFLGFVIALLPLFLKLNGQIDSSRDSKDILFIYLAITISALIPSKVREINRSVKWSLAYLMSMTVINQHTFFRGHVSYHTLNILIGMLFAIRLYESLDLKSVRYIFDGMILGALIQGVFTICGYYGFEAYFETVKYFMEGNPEISSPGSGVSNAVGSLGNSNLVASYLCMTIPAFFSRKKLIIFALIPLYALILTESYMGILSLIAGALYFLNNKKGVFSKTGVYSATIHLMLLTPFLNISLDSGRFEAWKRMLSQASLKHWLLGMGPGWFADSKMLMSDGITILEQEHNEFLAFFNIYGLAGIIALSPILYVFLKTKNINPLAATILFIAFCNSYGHFSCHQSTVVVIMIPILAICLVGDEKTAILS